MLVQLFNFFSFSLELVSETIVVSGTDKEHRHTPFRPHVSCDFPSYKILVSQIPEFSSSLLNQPSTRQDTNINFKGYHLNCTGLLFTSKCETTCGTQFLT